MEYRQLSGGEKVSTIGIGSGYLREASGNEIERIIGLAIERGVTLMDTVMNDDQAVIPETNCQGLFNQNRDFIMHYQITSSNHYLLSCVT